MRVREVGLHVYYPVQKARESASSCPWTFVSCTSLLGFMLYTPVLGFFMMVAIQMSKLLLAKL